MFVNALIMFLKILGLIVAAAVAAELLFIIFFMLASICFSKKKDYYKPNPLAKFLLYSMTRQVLFVAGIKTHVTGLELLPENKRFVLICNHRSNFDPITTWDALRKYDLAFITKKENFNIPWFGHLIKACCYMDINRENPRLAIPTIEKSICLLKDDKVSVAVYPEGTRSTDMNLHEFHGAVLKIPQRAEVPLVVMTCRGTEEIHKNFPFKKSHVYLDILKVYDVEEIKKLKTFEISEKATEDMLKVLGH